jgi:molybdate transport system permease protein
LASYIVYAAFALLVLVCFARAAVASRRSVIGWATLGVVVFSIVTLSARFVESLVLQAYLEPFAPLFRALVHATGSASGLAVTWTAWLFSLVPPILLGYVSAERTLRALRTNTDAGFLAVLWIIGYFYLFMLGAMLLADAFYTTPWHLLDALDSKEIRYAIGLSLKSCTLAAILSVWIAVPIGYLMSRFDFPGKGIVDALLDIPIVLPPLVVGLSLLILFHTPSGIFWEDNIFPVTYRIPSVVLSQFMVACAFAVRTMRATFEQINERQEQVALTLGCSRAQAFWRVVLPEARNGMITAGTLAWARSLGEFGPILVFAGATRMRTEVLPTTVYLELTTGSIEAAVAVSLIMVIVAVAVLFFVRRFGTDRALSRVL